MYFRSEEWDILGREIVSFVCDEDAEEFKIVTEEYTYSFPVYGDCCSSAIVGPFELDLPEKGTPLGKVVEVLEEGCDDMVGRETSYYEVVKSHYLLIRAENGSLKMYHTNISNGYYDNYVQVSVLDNKTGEYVQSGWY